MSAARIAAKLLPKAVIRDQPFAVDSPEVGGDSPSDALVEAVQRAELVSRQVVSRAKAVPSPPSERSRRRECAHRLVSCCIRWREFECRRSHNLPKGRRNVAITG